MVLPKLITASLNAKRDTESMHRCQLSVRSFINVSSCRQHSDKYNNSEKESNVHTILTQRILLHHYIWIGLPQYEILVR